jgi:hypothetical protein
MKQAFFYILFTENTYYTIVFSFSLLKFISDLPWYGKYVTEL